MPIDNTALLFMNRRRKTHDAAYIYAKDELHDAKKYLALGTPEARSIVADELRHAEYWIGLVVDPDKRQKLQTWHDELQEQISNSTAIMLTAANAANGSARKSHC